MNAYVEAPVESDTLNGQEFVEKVSETEKQLRSVASRKLWRKNDVDDVVAEATMVAWQKRESFTKGTNFRAWIFRILINKCWVANRNRGRNVEYEKIDDARDEPALSKEDIEYIRDNAEEYLSDDLLEGLNNLRAPERTCLWLRAMNDYSYKEIARILGIPLGTVMTHLHRGRTKIREYLARVTWKHERIV